MNPAAKICSLLVALVSFAGVEQVAAQLPVISSFSQNGLLVCSGLQTGSVASVEWASSLFGPWQTNWAGLDAVTATNGTIQVSVPMFYRVRATAASTNPPPLGAFALIPAGTFTMGDVPLDGLTNAPAHIVNVSAFYMAKNLTTKAEWDEVRTWALSHAYTGFVAGAGKGADHPVQTVSWYDALKYCNARSEMEGLTPCYRVGGAVMRTTSSTPPTVSWDANGYRLPTEAEWEKAARGGLYGKRFLFGDAIHQTQANFYNPDGDWYQPPEPIGFHPTYATGGFPYTSPVGSFPANGYGVRDMAGNVFQYCWDRFGPYDVGTPTDPRGATSGTVRVTRGGSWGNDPFYCRIAFRSSSSPSGASHDAQGFRVARSSIP